MLNAIFRSIFGTKHERDVKRMRPVVAEIAALEPSLQALSDEALRNRTTEMAHEHADLVDALLSGNGEVAARIVTDQIHASHKMVMAALLREPASPGQPPNSRAAAAGTVHP